MKSNNPKFSTDKKSLRHSLHSVFLETDPVEAEIKDFVNTYIAKSS